MELRCDICRSKQNGQCKGQPYESCEDANKREAEIYKNATDRIDHDRHAQNKHGSRRVAEAEERIKEAQKNPRPKPDPTPSTEHKSKPKHPTIDIGKPLFYKNRFTGQIQSGIVVAKSWHKFVFVFDNRTVTLPYNVIGTRLFLSAQEAQAKGKFTGP